MAEQKKRRDQRNFQVTLDKEEWKRFQTILTIAKTRFEGSSIIGDAEFKDAWVVKRIIGLSPVDNLVTQNEIEYFLGKAELEEKSLQDLGRATTEYAADDFDQEDESQKRHVA